MKSAEEILHDAVAAHQSGRLAAAEVAYRRVLRTRPDDHSALDGLALLSFQAGAKEQTIAYLLRSLVSEPNITSNWNWLGTLYFDTGRLIEAKAAFKRATELSPQSCEFWCNLATCMRHEGDFHGAEEHLRRALSCPPPLSGAYDALATLLRDQGRLEEAAQLALDWLAHEPTNPTAQHMAAASSGQEPPSRASDEYVRTHFDAFADAFDFALMRLNYRGPELVAMALRAAAARGHARSAPRFSAMLDAGCGTGLCGPLVRELSDSLVGVDLSPKMLHYARLRGCYDELVAAELGAFMRSRPRTFDAIVCVDTFVYFGALAEPLAAAHEAMRAGGPLVFTVEALLEDDAADHRLNPSGRYLHGETYLRRVVGECGFTIESIEQQILRKEMARDVAGYLVVARRP
jgi:predicted TPR repeat methyltransferase